MCGTRCRVVRSSTNCSSRGTLRGYSNTENRSSRRFFPPGSPIDFELGGIHVRCLHAPRGACRPRSRAFFAASAKAVVRPPRSRGRSNKRSRWVLSVCGSTTISSGRREAGAFREFQDQFPSGTDITYTQDCDVTGIPSGYDEVSPVESVGRLSQPLQSFDGRQIASAQGLPCPAPYLRRRGKRRPHSDHRWDRRRVADASLERAE